MHHLNLRPYKRMKSLITFYEWYELIFDPFLVGLVEAYEQIVLFFASVSILARTHRVEPRNTIETDRQALNRTNKIQEYEHDQQE
jgi:hypothetical protein